VSQNMPFVLIHLAEQNVRAPLSQPRSPISSSPSETLQHPVVAHWPSLSGMMTMPQTALFRDQPILGAANKVENVPLSGVGF